MSYKTINIFHLGVGNVGTTFLKQLLENRSAIERLYKIKINIVALYKSTGGIFYPQGIANLEQIVSLRTPERWLHRLLSGEKISKLPLNQLLAKCKLPLIVIDTTASDQIIDTLIKALDYGAFVVMSNKKPLSDNYQYFRKLQKYHHRLYFETTVGAGLPVISVLNNLLATGDEIVEIKGCFSGTLGFLFTQLEEGVPFSKAVLKAKEEGFTEPDPRDDLSGLDVGRKALILARILGQKLEMSDIKLESLYPNRMDKLTVEEFLEKSEEFDRIYKDKFRKIRKKRKTLRYIASISPKSCQVGVEVVSKNSDLGNLKGPDNMIVFKTKRYFDRPMIIKGPGAGVEVTAAGVFSEILNIIKIVQLST